MLLCYASCHHSFNNYCVRFFIKCFIDSMNGESDGADRIFLGGVPYYFSEAQMKELLESFGYVISRIFNWDHCLI